MTSLAGSARAVRLACVGIGLLFLVRGAFQPYFFPFFEDLAGLSYAKIAVLLNAYLLAQTLCTPSRAGTPTAPRCGSRLGTGMVLGMGGFLMTLGQPGSSVARSRCPPPDWRSSSGRSRSTPPS